MPCINLYSGYLFLLVLLKISNDPTHFLIRRCVLYTAIQRFVDNFLMVLRAVLFTNTMFVSK